MFVSGGTFSVGVTLKFEKSRQEASSSNIHKVLIFQATHCSNNIFAKNVEFGKIDVSEVAVDMRQNNCSS